MEAISLTMILPFCGYSHSGSTGNRQVLTRCLIQEDLDLWWLCYHYIPTLTAQSNPLLQNPTALCLLAKDNFCSVLGVLSCRPSWEPGAHLSVCPCRWAWIKERSISECAQASTSGLFFSKGNMDICPQSMAPKFSSFCCFVLGYMLFSVGAMSWEISESDSRLLDSECTCVFTDSLKLTF